MASSSGQAAFELSYGISPIILVKPSPTGVPGAQTPISSYLNSGASSGLLGQNKAKPAPQSANPRPTNQASSAAPFARFIPVTGGTLIDNDVAHWPLANQVVAANAVISKPLRISLMMICPASDSISYNAKQAIITNLQSVISSHIAGGGWFNVATPAYIYQGCLLLSLTDASDVTEGGQVQLQYVWEFEQPIITSQQAQVVMNTQMAKYASKTAVTGNPPGSDPAANSVANPFSGVAPNVVPAAQNLAGVGASVSIGTASSSRNQFF